MEQHLKVRIHKNVKPMLIISFFYYCIFQYCKTYISNTADRRQCIFTTTAKSKSWVYFENHLWREKSEYGHYSINHVKTISWILFLFPISLDWEPRTSITLWRKRLIFRATFLSSRRIINCQSDHNIENLFFGLIQ